MAATKRQGREKPMKIEQRKVKERPEDLSEGFRQNKQHSWLAQVTWGRPRGWAGGRQRALSLSLPHVLVRIFGSACPHAWRMDCPAIF